MYQNKHINKEIIEAVQVVRAVYTAMSKNETDRNSDINNIGNRVGFEIILNLIEDEHFIADGTIEPAQIKKDFVDGLISRKRADKLWAAWMEKPFEK
jgi:hypothetical protein